MAYDAAAVLEALERPSITVPRGGFFWNLLGLSHFFPGTKTYEGRLLSDAEFAPFRDRFIAAFEGTLSEKEIDSLWYDYLRAIGIPPRVVWRLPGAVAAEALESFFTCQVRASARAVPSPTSTSDLRRRADETQEKRTRTADASRTERSYRSSSGTMEPTYTSEGGGVGSIPPTA